MPRSHTQAETDAFRGRLKTVIKNADVLHLYDADVYLLVRRHGRCHEYTSTGRPNWPLSQVEVVREQQSQSHFRANRFLGAELPITC
jgi:hypothetical protein